MNYQNVIRQYLNNPPTLSEREETFQDTDSKADYTIALDNVDVTGALKRLFLPVKKCNFLVKLTIPGSSPIVLFLKSFTMPQAGVVFSEGTQENMFFPQPSVSCGAITMEGYILKDFSKTLVALYNNQFYTGLLAIPKNYQLTFSRVIATQDNDVYAHHNSLESAYGVVESFNSDFSQINLPIEDAVISKMYDLGDQEDDAAINTEDYISINDLMTLHWCKFDTPKIDTDVASNAFASVSLKVSYLDITYPQKGGWF